jgi:hypothetical protein
MAIDPSRNIVPSIGVAGAAGTSRLISGVDVRPSDPARPAGSDVVDFWAFGLLISPLVFIVGLVHHFGIESHAFVKLLALSVLGFAINYFLPLRHRLPFFAGLSVAAIAIVLDTTHAAWIIGLGGVLIAMCHLPLPLVWRVTLLVVTAAILAILRIGWIGGPWPAGIWPILGSMFMFRLIVYLYDVRHTPGLVSPARALSYFFLLPNVCFPLFPVIDYKTFCRGYYDAERHGIHHVGVQWIFRGVLQLLGYRIVYQTLVSDPAAVTDIATLWQYFTWPFLLYLRVSGQFHVIVGILHLFGFNLPETHHSYFLASSFTDFWRRINIYWKDFMMKVFYYPAYFALRKRGNTFALVASTILVFALTWVLHAYQWFWLRGTLLLAWNDVLFWTLLAVLVVFNSLHEWQHGRQRALGSRLLTWRDTASRTLKTVGMFCFISVLWSLWSTDSLGTWLSLWSAAGNWPDGPLGWPAILSLGVPLVVALAVLAESRSAGGLKSGSYGRTAAVVLVTASVLVIVSTSRVYTHLGTTGNFISSVRFGGLNQADVAGLERGYYENLMGADRLNGDLWSLYMNRPPDWQLTLVEGGVARSTDGFLPYELLPSAEGRFKGAAFRTNRWGMHDQEYAQVPPTGCRRIAVLGASHAMGSGVERQDTFEAVLERRLNEGQRGSNPACVEILNFAVYGYNPLQQLEVLERRLPQFAPQIVFYVAHPEDSRRVVDFLAGAVREGKELPYPALNDIVRRAGVDAGTPERLVEQRLAPFATEFLSWLYAQFVQQSRQREWCPAFIFMPMVPQMTYEGRSIELRLAVKAGFVPLDLMGVYDGADRNSLWIAEWDAHPNAAAHKLMADRLYELIARNQAGTCLELEQATGPGQAAAR